MGTWEVLKSKQDAVVLSTVTALSFQLIVFTELVYFQFKKIPMEPCRHGKIRLVIE